MKTKIMTAVLALSLGFNIAVLATFGHHWMERHGFGRPHKAGAWHLKKMRKMLNLTDDQVQFMAANRETLEKTIEPLRTGLEKKRGELFALLDAGTVDQAKVDQCIGEISLLQAQIEKAVVGNSIAVRQRLTPGQQVRFREFLKKCPWKGPHGPRSMREGKPF